MELRDIHLYLIHIYIYLQSTVHKYTCRHTSIIFNFALLPSLLRFLPGTPALVQLCFTMGTTSWKPGCGSHGSSRRVDVVELTSCWGGFFVDEQKTASLLFFRPCDGSKVQEKPTDGFILALFVCIYFYFWLAWRENSCTNWHGLHGRSEVAAWGSICRSIWDSRDKVCALHTYLEIEKRSFLLGSGTSGVEKLYMSISLIENLSIVGVLGKGIYSKINLKPGWKISSG